MTKAKLVLGVAVGLVVALLAGWIWGASGQSEMDRALQTSELRGELLGTRAAVLDARVAIYSVNFGEASRHLKDARGLLGRADERLKIDLRGSHSPNSPRGIASPVFRLRAGAPRSKGRGRPVPVLYRRGNPR